MEGFTYHNIFDTKGIEYIFVILFLATLIPFWLILNRRSKKIKLLTELFALSIDSLRIPMGVFFSKNHTWMHLNKNGLARVGLDDLLMHATGLVSINYIAEPGAIVSKGDPLAEIHHKANKLQIVSPVSGEIKKLNKNLLIHPENMNNKPFSEGWIIELKPGNWQKEIGACMLGDSAGKWMKQEIDRLKDFVLSRATSQGPEPAPVILQDGGELMDYPLQKLPDNCWCDFQENFLSI